jgi:hypothetical protein
LAKWMWLRLLCHMWGRSRGKPLFLASPPSTNCKMTSPWLQIGSRFLLGVWQGFYRSQWRSTWKSPAKGHPTVLQDTYGLLHTVHRAVLPVWCGIRFVTDKIIPPFQKYKKTDKISPKMCWHERSCNNR